MVATTGEKGRQGLCDDKFAIRKAI
ncbi:uncharacterized protein G2W53_018587 [Senna tora]|uniref:Uncharacterized protein n=1 Tax=Senna tora TaxID=362788 RepID=A0A834TS96_9FABA|nr:uncharacterized protein G2W53_018587 [Senna tora]